MIQGWHTFLSGNADQIDAPPGKPKAGAGEPIRLAFKGPGKEEMQIPFSAPVLLHSGQVYCSGSWSNADRCALEIEIPPTSFASQENGNVIRKEVDKGVFAWFPVPDGTGDYAFDPAAAIPVPAEGDLAPLGAWNVEPDTGEIFPVIGSPGPWALVDFPVQIAFCRGILLGQPFKPYTQGAEWIHPRWRLLWVIDRASEGEGEASAWLFTYRRTTR